MKVQDLLSLNSFAEAVVLAGKTAYSKEVVQVNVLEAPDIARWLGPGTVLLSSYYVLSDMDNSALAAFIQELADAGVVAFVLKLERFIGSVPAGLISCCERYGITLITVALSRRYADIISDILTPVLHTKAALLDKHYRLSRRMTALLMQDLSLNESINLFARELGHPLSLCCQGLHTTVQSDDAGRHQAQATHSQTSGTTAQTRAGAGHTPAQQEVPVHAHWDEATYLDGMAYEVQEFTGGRHQISVPLFLDADKDSRLIVHGVDTLSDDELVSLDNMVHYFRMNLLNQKNLDNLVYINRNKLVDELLSNRELSARNLESILSALDITVSHRYQIIQITRLDGSSPAGFTGLDNAVPADEAAFLESLKKRHRHLAYHSSPQRLVILINHPGSPAVPPDAGTALELPWLQQEIPRYFSRCVAGVSAVHSERELQDMMRESQQVKDIQKALGQYNQPMGYESLGLLKLLGRPKDRSAILELVPASYLRLFEGQPELFKTAVVYVRCGHNVQKCARELYVHPKTVSYRLSKLTTEYGIDLGQSQELMQLLFAATVLLGPETTPAAASAPAAKLGTASVQAPAQVSEPAPTPASKH